MEAFQLHFWYQHITPGALCNPYRRISCEQPGLPSWRDPAAEHDVAEQVGVRDLDMAGGERAPGILRPA
jgi:hypothetical protein